MYFPQCAPLVRRMEQDWQSPVFYGFWFDPFDTIKLLKLIDAFRVEYIASIDEPPDPELGRPFITESREFYLSASHLAPPLACAVATRFKSPPHGIHEHALISRGRLHGVHVTLDHLLGTETWGYAIVYASCAHRAVETLDTVTASLQELVSLETSWKL